MNSLFNQIKNINTKDRFLLFIVLFFPITFILGNLFINIFIVILSLSFFINLNNNKKYFSIKEIRPLYLLFFSLLINLIFSSDILNSLPRITKIIFVILFVIEIIRLLRKNEKFFFQYILKFWSLLVLIILLDCYLEFFSGQNLIQLASIIYILTSVLPLLPSGSFLSTFNSGIFWINYAIMLGINNRSKI